MSEEEPKGYFILDENNKPVEASSLKEVSEWQCIAYERLEAFLRKSYVFAKKNRPEEWLEHVRIINKRFNAGCLDKMDRR